MLLSIFPGIYDYLFGESSIDAFLLTIIFVLIISIIVKLRKIRKRSRNFYCKSSLKKHSILSYIDFLNRCKIRGLLYEKKNKEKLVKMLFKCFLDSVKNNVNELLIYTQTKDFEDKDPKELEDVLANTLDKTIEDYRMLFREKASRHITSDKIDEILRTSREENESHILSLGKIIKNVSNSRIYETNCEIINSILDSALGAIIQMSLNIERVAKKIDDNIEFKNTN